MEDQEIKNEIQRLSKEVEGQRPLIIHLIQVLSSLSNAVEEGFKEINERLSKLEGDHGMKGVNSQLTDIKQEINKIRHAYPYDEMFANLQSIQKGEA